MKSKVDIISGFLGAGKTTLIKKMLEEKLHTEKVVIIENEFGEVGIDGSVLKNSGIEVREINSGCICCTLVGDFTRAIQEVIMKYTPDRIIIEPSGVGKLSDVIKACDTPKLQEILTLNMLIAVVDALKYQMYKLNFGEFFENQINHAKTIILSRSQKVENKKLEAIAASIRESNPSANIITTPWEALPSEHIISVAEQDTSVSLVHQLTDTHVHHKECKCGCHHEHSHNHSASEVFDVWGIETPKIFEEKELNTKLKALENEKLFGAILRAKGILQLAQNKWVQFDYVPGEFDIKNTNANYTGSLCIIGKNLKKDELYNLFQVTS